MSRAPFLPDSMVHPPLLDPAASFGTPTPRRVLLVNPFYPRDRHASFGKHVLTPSLALTSIAASTPAGWTVDFWDENLLQGPPPTEPFPQVVGITVHLTFARRAFELSAWYRARGATVILGGLHVTSCPGECAPHADALVIGEGVQTWPQVLRDIESGSMKKVYTGSYREGSMGTYRAEPAPLRTILPRRDFLTTTSLIATRGCHNRCGFCYLSTEGLHIPYQTRDVDDIVRQFVENDEPYGVFIDNNLGSRPAYLRALCRALAPAKKIWSAAVAIDVTDDLTLVREMAASGCTGVFIGFESLAGINLDDAGKKSPRPADYARRVAVLHDFGIQVNGSFVFGFDHDDRDVFARTVEWIEENRLECATFHILTPYPGTPLFRQMEMEGRLLHRNWDLYDTAHVVFQPRRMSPVDLAEGYAWAYEHLFSTRSIWVRRPSRLQDVPGHLVGTWLYKRANHLWPFLIRHRLTHAVWAPLVAMSRWKHLRWRRRLTCHDGSIPKAALSTEGLS